MSATLHLPYVRFIRQAHTEPKTNTAWRATLAEAVELLKVAEWRAVATGTAVETPKSDPTLSFESDSFDTFKSSGDAVVNSGRQAAYVGMAAYRFKIPTEAITPESPTVQAKVSSLVIQAYADKFNWRGLLVTAYLSDADTPSTDWNVLRAGDKATPITIVDTLSRGILYDDMPASKTSTNKTETVTLTYTAPATPKAYLYVIVQHSDWLACKWEYWIEGSGMLDGATAMVTFDRVVTADPASEAYFFPIEPKDLYTPSKIYPLDEPSGHLALTGFGQAGQGTDPSGLVAISSAYQISLGLKSDGTVVNVIAWGSFSDSLNVVPSGLSGVIAIAAGESHNLALKSDGTVVGWGSNTGGVSTAPTGLASAIAISVGKLHSLALKSDGTVVGWGQNGNGQITIPTGLSGVVAIAAGGFHSLALKSDGTVVGWSTAITHSTGLTGVTAIACGFEHALALKSDGTVVGWGGNTAGQITIPTGLSGVVAIAAGDYHSLALKSDGTVVAWGDNSGGQATVPSGLANVVSITAGTYQSLVLTRMFNGWQVTTIAARSSNASLGIPAIDVDAQRKIKATRTAEFAFATATITNQAYGTISWLDVATNTTLAGCAKALSYSFALDGAVPNKLVLSLPDLSEDADSELYARVALLKDNGARPVSPIASIANWRTVWRGGVPTGYTQLGSAYVRHTGFVNSYYLPIASPGTEGVVWLVIMPIYAPMTGDSLAWDITQTGFDASTIFMLRS